MNILSILKLWPPFTGNVNPPGEPPVVVIPECRLATAKIPSRFVTVKIPSRFAVARCKR
jgi:hypothetical protein